jgi:hypothetical protein
LIVITVPIPNVPIPETGPVYVKLLDPVTVLEESL